MLVTITAIIYTFLLSEFLSSLWLKQGSNLRSVEGRGWNGVWFSALNLPFCLFCSLLSLFPSLVSSLLSLSPLYDHHQMFPVTIPHNLSQQHKQSMSSVPFRSWQLNLGHQMHAHILPVLIFSLYKHLLSTYYMSGSVPG